MKNNTEKIALSAILVALVLTSCSPTAIATRSLATSTAKSQPSVITFTSTADHSPTSTTQIPQATFASATSTREQLSFPSIVVNLGPVMAGECRGRLPRNQIWHSTYPYKNFQPLLSDPEIDYVAPSFSPNNEWIAAVAWNPAHLDPSEFTSQKVGFDRVVVTRPDGTDQQVVGKNMPAKEIGDQISGCIFDSYILPEVWWSPDNQHLIFEERKYDKNQGKYIDNVYLTEIGTQALNQLMQSVNMAEWINNDELLVQGDNKLYLLSGITQDNIVKKEIPYPPEIDPSPAVYTSSQPDGTIVVSFSEEKISEDFHISREISVWKLVLGPDVTWKKIVDYGKSNWNFPILGARYAVTCDDENNQIIVLNANDLTEVNHLDLPGSTEIDCGTLQVMHEGGDIAYFAANIGAKPSLFKVPLGNDKLEPVLVFDSNQISLEPSETGYYLNYSVENITK